MAKSYGRMLRLAQMSFTVNGQVPDTQKLTGYRKSFLAVVTAGFMALMHVEMETVAQNSFGNLIAIRKSPHIRWVDVPTETISSEHLFFTRDSFI